MNTDPSNSLMDFPFVPQKDLPYKLSKFQSYSLRQRIPRGIYWVKTERRILWNQILIIDYFTNGLDTDQHRALVESYLSNLPVSFLPSSPKGNP
jgi:hypothetical protein